MSTSNAARFHRISAAEAADLIVRHRRRVLPELALYDVRDRQSFERGHIEGAEHLHEKKLTSVLQNIPKRTPVVVYCYHGNASQTYAAIFSDFRFAEVYSVDGGFESLTAAVADHERQDADGPANLRLSDALTSFLLEHRFDASRLNAHVEHGLTPLMRAALAGRAVLVDELLALGADIRARNTDGNNALWLACVSNDERVVRRLIEAGIDVDNRNDAGATALMYAASSGKGPLVEILLHSGADPELRNQDDFQAIDLATTWACLCLLREMPKRLRSIERGADRNER
jgi:rhodanese-related sulfurtransferase